MEVSTATNSACTAKSLIVRHDEFAAVKDSIDVGNVLYTLYGLPFALKFRGGILLNILNYLPDGGHFSRVPM